MSAITSSQWFVHDRNAGQADTRLFVFPHGGGSPAQYRQWQALLGGDCKVYTASLPGRGARFLEAPIADMPTLITALSKAILPLLGTRNIFFGHSLGSIVAYELARALESGHARKLQKLIVSAKNAPHVPRTTPPLHHLPDAEFIDALRQYGGTPDEILDDWELMQLQLPMLRADFALSETYVCEEMMKLACPIHVFSGAEDRFTTPAGARAMGTVFSEGLQPGRVWRRFLTFECVAELFTSLKRQVFCANLKE